MKMKKLLSLTLALALGASLLSGCAKKEEKPDASGSGKKPALEAMDLSTVTDPYLATAGLAGDTVVAKVGSHDILAADYLYWLNYDIESTLYQIFGSTDVRDIPWDTPYAEGTLEENFRKHSLEAAAFHALLPELAEKEGLSLTEEEKKFLADDLAQALVRAGSQEDLEHIMWIQMSTVDQFSRVYQSGCHYTHLSNLYYGPDSGHAPTDAQAKAFAEEELGQYRAKHILLSTIDTATREPLDEATCAEKKAKADDLLAQIRAAADPVAKFDELMRANSEDPGLAQAPDGYNAQKGQMVPEFESTALALADGEISDVVEIPFGYHIILRLPLERLEPVKEIYVAHEMEKRVDQWLEEDGGETTDAFDKIDIPAFREKVMALQLGVKEEVAAKVKEQQSAPDGSNVPDGSNAPAASAPEGAGEKQP